MITASAIALLMGSLLVAAPAVYSGEKSSMSDAQHRKTMGGMHHPDQGDGATENDDAEKEGATMSDTQHRKTMGGNQRIVFRHERVNSWPWYLLGNLHGICALHPSRLHGSRSVGQW